MDIFLKTVNKRLEDSERETTNVLQVQCELPAVRVRAKKRMPGENAVDEPIVDVIAKFRVEVYNSILDKVVTSLQKRFSKLPSYMKNSLHWNPMSTLQNLKNEKNGVM